MEDDFAILTSQRMNYQVLLSTGQTLLQIGLISAFILLFTHVGRGRNSAEPLLPFLVYEGG